MIYFISPTGDDSAAGTFTAPWKSLPQSVNRLSAGDILYVRGGDYVLTEAVICQKSGSAERPIEIAAYGSETPVFDAASINFHAEKEKYPYGTETGAVFFEGAAHIRFAGIHVRNSTGHGIAVRDANHIVIDRCGVRNTFSCGISLWDTHSTARVCHNNRIIGNTVTRATTYDMLPAGRQRGHEPPHEAISIAGACYFEVAYNHVYDCDKEGIDVKENAHHGSVHHNHVHHVDRQGLYADAWFGPLTHVDFHDNTVHDCKGAGIVVAVEQGHCVSNIRIYGNTVYDCWGSGILSGIFGADNIRSNIDIFNNTVRHNGHGDPAADYGDGYFWITGGLCLLSAQMTHTRVYNNVFEDNKGFDIGYGARFCPNGEDIAAVFAKKKIRIFGNLILTKEAPPPYPITTPYENSVLYGL